MDPAKKDNKNDTEGIFSQIIFSLILINLFCVPQTYYFPTSSFSKQDFKDMDL